MAGAQSCGWYDEAVQLVANIDRYKREQQGQRNKDSMNMLNAYSQQLTNQHNAWRNQSDKRIGQYNKWIKNKNKTPPPPPPPPQDKNPPDVDEDEGGGHV